MPLGTLDCVCKNYVSGHLCFVSATSAWTCGLLRGCGEEDILNCLAVFQALRKGFLPENLVSALVANN